MNQFKKLMIASMMTCTMSLSVSAVNAKTTTKTNTKVTAKATTKKATKKAKKQTIKLNSTTKALTVGTSFTLKLTGTKTKAAWSVSNGRVKLSKKTKNSVKVTAVKNGNVYVSAKIGKTYYSCYVKIGKKGTTTKATLAVSSNKVTLAQGAYTTLTYTTKTDVSKMSITNADKDIVSANLSDDGKTVILNGLKAGTATLTLKDNVNKTSAEITVTVTDNSASFTIDNDLPGTFSTYTSDHLSAVTTLSNVNVTSTADDDSTSATITGKVKVENLGTDDNDNHVFINYSINDSKGHSVKSGTIMLFNVQSGQTYNFTQKVSVDNDNSYVIHFSDYR